MGQITRTEPNSKNQAIKIELKTEEIERTHLSKEKIPCLSQNLNHQIHQRYRSGMQQKVIKLKFFGL